MSEEFSLFYPFDKKRAVFFLCLIGFTVYFNMLFNGFVWDDLSYIVGNPDIHSVNLSLLFNQNSFNHISGQYRALTATYFAIIYGVSSQSTFLFHLIQLTIHLANTILLLYLFDRLFTLHLSFFLSLIFLIHPMQVESVSFIGAAGNPLFFIFGLTALLISMRRLISAKASVVITSLLSLSLLAKETGLLFILLVILAGFISNRKNQIRLTVSGFLSLVIYSIFRFAIAGVYFDNSSLINRIPIHQLSTTRRLINIPGVMFYYIKTFFYPKALAIDQLWVIYKMDWSGFFLPLLSLILICLLLGFIGIRIYKSGNRIFTWFIFFALWTSMGFLFHSQIVPLDGTVADRWFYFTIAGLLGLIGVILSFIHIKNIRHNTILYALAAAAVISLSVRTIVRNSNWTDNLTLFTHDAAVITNYEIENNIGSFYTYAGRYREALPHTLGSVNLYPYDINLSNLGYIYEQLGDYENAAKYYQASISTPVTSGDHDKFAQYSYFRWAGLYLLHDNLPQGLEIITRATAAYPDNGIFWAFRGAAEYLTGDDKSALVSASKARQILPGQNTDNLYRQISSHQSVDIKKL